MDSAKNPFLKQIDSAAIDVADAEKLERKALDSLLLADAERGALRKRMRSAQEIHGANGAVMLDQKTGRPIDPEAYARVDAKREEAEHAYTSAATVASQARGKLGNAQKASEVWERTAQYWAQEAQLEAAMTPAERAVRERRDAYQRDQAAR